MLPVNAHDLGPGFLLAAPDLLDPHFHRTVVLLGIAEDGGALGWTLNGPAVATGATVVRATGLVPADASLPASFERPATRGGPVSPESVWIVYRVVEGEPLLPGSLVVGTEIAVTTSVDALRAFTSGERQGEFQLVVGYAGWGASQLAAEITGGSWVFTGADPSLVFGEESQATETLWERAYQKTMGVHPGAFVGGKPGSA